MTYQETCDFFKSKNIVIKERGNSVMVGGLFLYIPATNKCMCFNTNKWFNCSSPEKFYTNYFKNFKEVSKTEEVKTITTKEEIEKYEYIFDE